MGFARCAQNCSQTASTSRLGTTMWVLHSGNEWSPFSKDAGQGHFEGPPQQPPRSRCVTRGIRVAVRVGRAGTAMWGRRPSRGGDCARARPRDRRGRDPRHQPTCGCGCGMVHRPFGRAGRATAVTHICLWSGAGGPPLPSRVSGPNRTIPRSTEPPEVCGRGCSIRFRVWTPPPRVSTVWVPSSSGIGGIQRPWGARSRSAAWTAVPAPGCGGHGRRRRRSQTAVALVSP